MPKPRQENEWVALLEGDLAERAEAAIEAIAAAVREKPGAAVEPGSPVMAAQNATLAGGVAGQGIFFGYLARTFGREEDSETTIDLIDQAIEAVAEVPLSDSLYSGFTGIAWAVEHLRDLLTDEDDDEDPNEAIDEAVLTRVSTTPWRSPYDLIIGLVGMGVYGLERWPLPTGVAVLEQVLERLLETSEEQSGGRTWHTGPEHLPPWQRELEPDGYYNLGLAHGVPGVIGLLAGMVAADVAVDRSRSLLGDAVTWQLAKRLPDGAIGWFDSWETEKKGKPARSAWCYGDPGVACSLYLAGAAAGVPEWLEHAKTMMRLAWRRPAEDAGVMDVGLCHGALGLAHIFNRFFQATGDEPFADAARFWYRHGLDMLRPGEGVAGVLTYRPEPDGTPRYDPDPGLLTGAAGVGLALLAATTTVEPAWDRMMLTSLSPR